MAGATSFTNMPWNADFCSFSPQYARLRTKKLTAESLSVDISQTYKPSNIDTL